MKHDVALSPAPATAIEAAFLGNAKVDTFPGQCPPADWAFLNDLRRIARFILFEYNSARCGYGAAIAFRRKDKKFVASDGSRPGWKLCYVILPREFTDYRLQEYLNAAQPPLLVEEAQLAVDLLRTYVEQFRDKVPDLGCKWDEIHRGKGSKSVLLHPPKYWEPTPPRKMTAIRYDLAPTSLCSRWLERHGSANIPPKLELELRSPRRMMGK